jgi:hypothetical protein
MPVVALVPVARGGSDCAAIALIEQFTQINQIEGFWI